MLSSSAPAGLQTHYYLFKRPPVFHQTTVIFRICIRWTTQSTGWYCIKENMNKLLNKYKRCHEEVRSFISRKTESKCLNSCQKLVTACVRLSPKWQIEGRFESCWLWTQRLRSGAAELALWGIIFFVSKRKPSPKSRIFQGILCPSKDKCGIGTNIDHQQIQPSSDMRTSV